MTIRIAIIGYGKIARDQHDPAISADPRFELAAVATPGGDPSIGLPWFATDSELFAAMAGRLDAVAICTPPVVRHAIGEAALRAGLNVLLEKPPAATLGEIEHLEQVAGKAGRSLYAAWHSQHAPGVARAATFLSGQTIAGLQISWLEDVRKWHPGQEWVWAPGGFGVFDPGINALSIVSRILPMPLFVRDASLIVPSNKQAPIAARVSFGEGFEAVMDWRHSEAEQWTIRVQTASGSTIELRDGGARLLVDGVEQSVGEIGEYPSIYDSFAKLVAAQRSEVDREPLRIAADVFLVARRELTDPFE